MAEFLNLNHLRIPSDGSPVPIDNPNWSVGEIEVHFRGLNEQLCRLINEADYVFGCVAWLTDDDILDRLATKDGVSIVVQKEDFLRPEEGARADWQKAMHAKYAAIEGVDRFSFSGGLARELSTCHDTNVAAIRCMGPRNQGRSSARMHNKFA